MNVYITIGTHDFLKNIHKKYPSETMVMMTNENGSLLFHETSSASVFKEPRKYEVIESNGDIKKARIVIMDNIPVTDEGRPLFEQKFKNQLQSMENQTGLIATRLLQPLATNTYVILTAWDSVLAFQAWKQTDAYFMSGNKQELDPQVNIFESAPYESSYTITD